jgi:predicted RNase H-like nuclease
LNQSSGPDAPGLSLQARAIIPKIREVDELITPSLQKRIIEVHPELCFYEMNRRRPVVEPKKTAEGRKRRIRFLESEWRRKLDELIDSRPRGVGRDDVIDAMAACWTAERVLKGKAIRTPGDPPRDLSGLRMEIVR